MLVPAGFTSTTRRPASAALPVRMLVNCAQPASRIDLFSPALARAWLGRNVPAFRIRASYLFQLSGLHLVGDALLMQRHASRRSSSAALYRSQWSASSRTARFSRGRVGYARNL